MSNILNNIVNGGPWDDVGGGFFSTTPSPKFVSITGTGFGSDGVPLLFQDFSDTSLALNTDIDTLGIGWQAELSNGPTVKPFITDSDSYTGSRCAIADFDDDGDCAMFTDFTGQDEVYLTFWHKINITSGAPSNTKAARIMGTEEIANTFTRYPGAFNQDHAHTAGNNHNRFTIAPSSSSSVPYSVGSDGPFGEWHRIEMYLKHGTAGGSDGLVQFFKELVQNINITNAVTRDTVVASTLYSRVMMPFFFGQGAGPSTGFGQYLMDNIYIGDGLARVELTNDETYNPLNKREVMKTLTRADTIVDVEIVENTFSAGPAFLHVINSVGASIQSQPYTVA